jgi:hypothetical protein
MGEQADRRDQQQDGAARRNVSAVTLLISHSLTVPTADITAALALSRWS